MKDERKTLAKLQYTIDSNDEIYIDICLDDYSDSTISKFALLLASIPTTSFRVQTLQVAHEAFTRDGRDKELHKLVNQVLANQKTFEDIDNIRDEDEDEDDPLIKPTDLIT